jgi:Dyp-type peroxidase family
MTLDLGNVQGNIVPGFNKDHQAFLFVSFRDTGAGQRWLASLQAQVASSQEVLGFKNLFQAIKSRRSEDPTTRDRGALSVISATWVNVALSSRGLQIIGATGYPDRFGVEFRSNTVPGVARDARYVDIHALLIVAADHPHDLDAAVQLHRQKMVEFNIFEVASLRGDTLPGELRGREQFGFADGVSQPRMAGTPFGNGPPVAPGEFVLGYLDETGEPSGNGLPTWARDGSFLVFLQLEQHVGAFRRAIQHEADHLDLHADELAAEIVGRYPDGAAIEPRSRFSHVGRGSPQWLAGEKWLRHRLIRRGIPYGQPLVEGGRDDGGRGLYFLSYQADIGRQFEYVWARFLNAPDFPSSGNGRDALTGLVQMPGESPLTDNGHTLVIRTDQRPATAYLGQKGQLISLRLPAFVTPHYGGYFFAPSISALADLGREPYATIPAGSTGLQRSDYPPA